MARSGVSSKRSAASARGKQNPRKPAASAARPGPRGGGVVLVGTRKGLWFLKSDAKRKTWVTTQGWFTVKRQAFCSDSNDPLGLYFGTTSGEVWASADEGDAWRCIARHLPHVYSVTTGVMKA